MSELVNFYFLYPYDTDGDAGFLSDWNSLLECFLPRQISMTRAKREWEYDILSRYRSLVWEDYLFICL